MGTRSSSNRRKGTAASKGVATCVNVLPPGTSSPPSRCLRPRLRWRHQPMTTRPVPRWSCTDTPTCSSAPLGWMTSPRSARRRRSCCRPELAHSRAERPSVPALLLHEGSRQNSATLAAAARGGAGLGDTVARTFQVHNTAPSATDALARRYEVTLRAHQRLTSVSSSKSPNEALLSRSSSMVVVASMPSSNVHDAPASTPLTGTTWCVRSQLQTHRGATVAWRCEEAALRGNTHVLPLAGSTITVVVARCTRRAAHSAMASTRACRSLTLKRPSVSSSFLPTLPPSRDASMATVQSADKRDNACHGDHSEQVW